jgi:tryptophan synthase alpha chain
MSGDVVRARGLATGIERIAATFAAVRAEGRRAALMPYLMGGFPDADCSRRVGLACAEHGADLLEVGIPYSDPLADGPVIHDAGSKALAAGVRTDDVLDVARDLAEVVPVVVMCYANLVYARGVERFAGDLAGRGVSGLIVPDLPLEEGPEFLAACDAQGIALVPLVAPTTPAERLAAIGERARGFVYTVAVLGTTGERSGPATGLAGVLARTKAAMPVPVALGFGISTPADAAAAADAGAEGVIVGSRLVRAAAEAADAGEDPAAAVGALVAGLSGALNR